MPRKRETAEQRKVRIARIAGENAWTEYVSVEENPYPEGTARRLAWEQGWHAAAQRGREWKAFLARVRREDKARKDEHAKEKR